MAQHRQSEQNYVGTVRRLLFGILMLFLFVSFVVWRIDGPRAERFRAMIVDRFVPSMDWAMVPVTGTANLVRDFQSYQQLSEQNQELRRELQQMKAWKEAAVRLEQENAKLRDLNQVALDPRLTYVTGVVLADSGSPFRQSVLLNVGARDGVLDGWAAMDGIGLVGRISGVGDETARVILLTDTSSRIPVTVQPSGQRAIMIGDNTQNPPLDFIEDTAQIKPGDRIVTSGDGEVFPPDLVVGTVALGSDARLRTRLAADYGRLEFLRVLRSSSREGIDDPGALLPPVGLGLPDDAAAEETVADE